MSSEKGFTLLEVLTVVMIMAVIFTAMAFGLGGARSGARDDRRKADLAAISAVLEKYRADCGTYPTKTQYDSVPTGGILRGSGITPACTAASIYMDGKLQDPENPARVYSYSTSLSNSRYTLCAALEQTPSSLPDTSACGSCGSTCNYVVVNP